MLWSRQFSVMGTECALCLFADSERKADEISDLAVAEVLRIEAKYSRYRHDSMLSTINGVAARGGSIELDEETSGLPCSSSGSLSGVN